MGSASRFSALEEFVAGEAEALRADLEARLPEAVRRLNPRIVVQVGVDEVERALVFTAADGTEEWLYLAALDYFWLEQAYPEYDFSC
jgi:hypothetical protein